MKWSIEFYANGELQTVGKLTDKQIKQVHELIISLGGQDAGEIPE